MADKINGWKPDQEKLLEASRELQEVKNKFDSYSPEYRKIQNALDKIKAVIFNY